MTFVADVPETVRAKARAAGAEAWLAGLPELLAELCDEWGITLGRTYPDATEALVTEATRADGSAAVLKVCVPRRAEPARDRGSGGVVSARDGRSPSADPGRSPSADPGRSPSADPGRSPSADRARSASADRGDPADTSFYARHEITALRLAGGSGCVPLLAASEERGAILLPRLGPSMADVGLPFERRLPILIELARRVWRPAAGYGLPTGDEKARWLAGFIVRSWRELDRPCAERTVEDAVACTERRAAAHDDERAVLVHGDVHQWNALRNPIPFNAPADRVPPSGSITASGSIPPAGLLPGTGSVPASGSVPPAGLVPPAGSVSPAGSIPPAGLVPGAGSVSGGGLVSAADGYSLVDPDGLLAEPEYDLGVLMREDPEELMAGDPWDRARWLAAATGTDATAIWEWGVAERVSTGLLATAIGLQPIGRRMLAAADRISATADRT